MPGMCKEATSELLCWLRVMCPYIAVVRRPLPHSLYDFDGAEVCLIVKDHKGVRAVLSRVLTGAHGRIQRH